MEYNSNTPSCLMLAADLITPVLLKSIFETEDLKEDGFVTDSHITLLYSHSFLDKSTILPDIIKVVGESSISKNIVGGFNILDFLKHQNIAEPRPVFDLFELGNFENESGYVVLKLKKDTGLFEILNTINSGLSKLYNVKSDFGEFTPHLSIAEVNKGMSEKYLTNESLILSLENSKVKMEDFIFSYTREDGKYDRFDLTQHNSVDRYFREKNLKKESEELDSDENK